MSTNGDELKFKPEDDSPVVTEEISTTPEPSVPAWKLIIVDDEEEVHTTTRLVLAGISFEGRRIEFLSAYSGEEAKVLIKQHPDTAVILLDVVMETEHSGLEVARFIRSELDNKFVRVILRTGHPGQAPEMDVILKYDINDYKEKGDLTYQKLCTAIIASLRSYKDLRIIEKNRLGLKQIIDASSNLFQIHAPNKLSAGVLDQITSLLMLDDQSLSVPHSGFTAVKQDRDYVIVAAKGRFNSLIYMPVQQVVSGEIVQYIDKAVSTGKSLYQDGCFIGYFRARNDSENLVYLEVEQAFSEMDKHLLEVFSVNVAIAFDNISLNQEIVETQKEMIYTLGEVVETRSKETAYHVKRVAEISHLLALKAGLNEDYAQLLKEASPMHDVGKVGIPDTILNKPGKLTSDEFEVIKTHTAIGYDILKNSERKVLHAAATVALQHHERWDGQGYPEGKKAEGFHIFGRITSLADVFDALSHPRVYKEAWALDRILELIKAEKGKQFDPNLVDLFLNNLDEFIAIQNASPDK
jgi:response regulator RpfG family c-di-GMP phosphodiesterase